MEKRPISRSKAEETLANIMAENYWDAPGEAVTDIMDILLGRECAIKPLSQWTDEELINELNEAEGLTDEGVPEDDTDLIYVLEN